MAFSFFTKDVRDKSIALLVDIGSSSVGCALVRMEKGRVPHILFTTRENISFQESLSSAKFYLAMNHALERSLKKVQVKQLSLRSSRCPRHGDSKSEFGNSSGDPSADSQTSIFCTLASPWFILKSRHLNIVKQAPFTITEQVLEGFLNEDIERLKEELKETLPSKDVAIIEKKIIQIKLNGYDIKVPYGKTTSQAEVVMTVGVSSSKVIEGIRRKFSQFFHTPSVHFGAFPMAAFSAVRDIFPTEKNFFFVDITGEATDVSLIVGDLLVGNVSFPRGKNFFIREISTQFCTLHEEATTLFAMYLRNELPSAKHALVDAVVVRAKGEWLTRFEKAVTTLANNGMLPRKVFFTTDADIAELFSRLIVKAKTELLLGGSFDVQFVDQSIVSKFVSFEAEVLRDPFLVIEALLAVKIIFQNT